MVWQAAIRHICLLLCSAPLLLFLFSCNNDKQPPAAGAAVHAMTATDSAALHADTQLVDSCIALLRTGDVVVRTGIGPDSYMLREMNSRDKTYSHCGIVIIEHGSPVVYHSIGGEDNPDARLRTDAAAVFFSPARNTGIGIIRYDVDSAALRRLSAVVHGWYLARPLFDLQFDMATDDKLYCSEFVYKSLCAATADTAYIPLSSFKGHRYAGIDDLYLNAHARLVCKVRFK